MNNRIYMFRGKASTGKTSLAHYLGKNINCLRHPLPHQFFTSFEEVKNYYEKSNIEQLDNEIYVDSSRPFDENIQSIAHYFEK